MSTRWLCHSSFALVALPSCCGCQPESRRRPAGADVLGDSELVVLHVTVRDRKGAYVGGLTRTRSTSSRMAARKPSVSSPIPTRPRPSVCSSTAVAACTSIGTLTIAGAAAFAEASHPQDEIFALAFNEHVSAVLPAGAPFTSDSRVLRGALEHGISSRGRTALYDAIASGVDYLSRGVSERKVLVVLSDGGDNASRTSRDEAVHKAQASNAVIYTIALIEPGSRDANPVLLKELSRESGGESFRPKDSEGIGKALSQIAGDIRHTYTIGYTSTNTARDGAFRSVRVVVTAPPGRPLVVRSRTGLSRGFRRHAR